MNDSLLGSGYNGPLHEKYLHKPETDATTLGGYLSKNTMLCGSGITGCVRIQELAYECDSTSQTRSSLRQIIKVRLSRLLWANAFLGKLVMPGTFQRLDIHLFGTSIHHAQALGACAYGTTWTAILGLGPGPKFTSGGLMFLLACQA